MPLLSQLATVPDANDDHFSVRIDPIAKDVGARTEGRENFSPTGVVVHAASNLRKLAELLGSRFDAGRRTSGSL